MGSRDFGQGTQMCSEHSSVVMGTATHFRLLHTLEGTPASTRQAELGFPKPMSGPVGFFLPLSPGLTVLLLSPYSVSVHAYGSAPPTAPLFPPEPHAHERPAGPSLEPCCCYTRLSPPPGWDC